MRFVLMCAFLLFPILAKAAPVIDEPGTLSAHEKNVAVQPLVTTATQCVVRTVTASPQFEEFRHKDLRDLAVESLQKCADSIQEMVDGYNHYFGSGTGEAVFLGPYLDALPAIVKKWADAQE